MELLELEAKEKEAKAKEESRKAGSKKSKKNKGAKPKASAAAATAEGTCTTAAEDGAAVPDVQAAAAIHTPQLTVAQLAELGVLKINPAHTGLGNMMVEMPCVPLAALVDHNLIELCEPDQAVVAEPETPAGQSAAARALVASDDEEVVAIRLRSATATAAAATAASNTLEANDLQPMVDVAALLAGVSMPTTACIQQEHADSSVKKFKQQHKHQDPRKQGVQVSISKGPHDNGQDAPSKPHTADDRSKTAHAHSISNSNDSYPQQGSTLPAAGAPAAAGVDAATMPSAQSATNTSGWAGRDQPGHHQPQSQQPTSRHGDEGTSGRGQNLHSNGADTAAQPVQQQEQLTTAGAGGKGAWGRGGSVCSASSQPSENGTGGRHKPPGDASGRPAQSEHSRPIDRAHQQDQWQQQQQTFHYRPERACSICAQVGHTEDDCDAPHCTFANCKHSRAHTTEQHRSSCFNCGEVGHQRLNCRAYKCKLCLRAGHYSAQCYLNRPQHTSACSNTACGASVSRQQGRAPADEEMFNRRSHIMEQVEHMSTELFTQLLEDEIAKTALFLADDDAPKALDEALRNGDQRRLEFLIDRYKVKADSIARSEDYAALWEPAAQFTRIAMEQRYGETSEQHAASQVTKAPADSRARPTAPRPPPRTSASSAATPSRAKSHAQQPQDHTSPAARSVSIGRSLCTVLVRRVDGKAVPIKDISEGHRFAGQLQAGNASSDHQEAAAAAASSDTHNHDHADIRAAERSDVAAAPGHSTAWHLQQSLPPPLPPPPPPRQHSIGQVHQDQTAHLARANSGGGKRVASVSFRSVAESSSQPQTPTAEDAEGSSQKGPFQPAPSSLGVVQAVASHLQEHDSYHGYQREQSAAASQPQHAADRVDEDVQQRLLEMPVPQVSHRHHQLQQPSEQHQGPGPADSLPQLIMGNIYAHSQDPTSLAQGLPAQPLPLPAALHGMRTPFTDEIWRMLPPHMANDDNLVRAYWHETLRHLQHIYPLEFLHQNIPVEMLAYFDIPLPAPHHHMPHPASGVNSLQHTAPPVAGQPVQYPPAPYGAADDFLQPSLQALDARSAHEGLPGGFVPPGSKPPAPPAVSHAVPYMPPSQQPTTSYADANCASTVPWSTGIPTPVTGQLATEAAGPMSHPIMQQPLHEQHQPPHHHHHHQPHQQQQQSCTPGIEESEDMTDIMGLLGVVQTVESQQPPPHAMPAGSLPSSIHAADQPTDSESALSAVRSAPAAGTSKPSWAAMVANQQGRQVPSVDVSHASPAPPPPPAPADAAAAAAQVHDYPALGQPEVAAEPVDEEEEEFQKALQASLAHPQPDRYHAGIHHSGSDANDVQVPARLEPAVSAAGLANQAGEYNCFLNVVIQCLWHCEAFQKMILAVMPHMPSGNATGPIAVVCELLQLFQALQEAESDWDPTQTRYAQAASAFTCV